ncbi:MAG: type II toxin-antitoxin system PemK/MazF family toxin [Gemmatimonadaceae bacterium]
MKRYEIRWAHLDPARGAEMKKRHPVVIVSLDALNDRLDTVTVCPLTTSLHPEWRTRVSVRAGKRDAEIAVDQIRTISKIRLANRIGELTSEQAAALRRLITQMYGE